MRFCGSKASESTAMWPSRSELGVLAEMVLVIQEMTALIRRSGFSRHAAAAEEVHRSLRGKAGPRVALEVVQVVLGRQTHPAAAEEYSVTTVEIMKLMEGQVAAVGQVRREKPQ